MWLIAAYKDQELVNEIVFDDDGVLKQNGQIDWFDLSTRPFDDDLKRAVSFSSEPLVWAKATRKSFLGSEFDIRIESYMGKLEEAPHHHIRLDEDGNEIKTPPGDFVLVRPWIDRLIQVVMVIVIVAMFLFVAFWPQFEPTRTLPESYRANPSMDLVAPVVFYLKQNRLTVDAGPLAKDMQGQTIIFSCKGRESIIKTTKWPRNANWASVELDKVPSTPTKCQVRLETEATDSRWQAVF